MKNDILVEIKIKMTSKESIFHEALTVVGRVQSENMKPVLILKAVCRNVAFLSGNLLYV